MTKCHDQGPVLVVEDDEDCGDVLCCLFEMVGRTCVVARRGQEALTNPAARYTLALVDLALPDMTGYEVAGALRRQHGDAIYLVALTGFSDHEHRARAITANFDRYLVKPVSIQVFRTMLSDAQGTMQSRRLAFEDHAASATAADSSSSSTLASLGSRRT